MTKMKECMKAISQPKCASGALLLLRLVAGVAFLYHGYGKITNPFDWMQGAPVPGILQALAAIAEFGGGIALILGALIPLAMLGLAITMAVATCMHAFVMKDPFVAQGPGQGSYELALLYFAIAIMFMAVGPGKFSVDSKLFGERQAKSC